MEWTPQSTEEDRPPPGLGGPSSYLPLQSHCHALWETCHQGRKSSCSCQIFIYGWKSLTEVEGNLSWGRPGWGGMAFYMALDSGLQPRVLGNFDHFILLILTTGTPQPPSKEQDIGISPRKQAVRFLQNALGTAHRLPCLCPVRGTLQWTDPPASIFLLLGRNPKLFR